MLAAADRKPGSDCPTSQHGISRAVLVDSKGGAGPRPWARTQTEWLMQHDLKLQNCLQTVS
jgi:hypothetical protein